MAFLSPPGDGDAIPADLTWPDFTALIYRLGMALDVDDHQVYFMQATHNSQLWYIADSKF